MHESTFIKPIRQKAIILAAAAALIFARCSPAAEPPKTLHYESNRIIVNTYDTGEYVVSFYDAALGSWSPDIVQSAMPMTQGTYTVSIVNDAVQLVNSAALDSLGHAAMSTYSVYEDHSAMEIVKATAGAFFDAYVYFIESDYRVAYTASMSDSRNMFARFTYAAGGSVGNNTAVIQTYHPDSTKQLNITNPYGTGPATFILELPFARHADVTQIMFSYDNLDVFKMNTGDYILDYYDVSGLCHTYGNVNPAVLQNLYTQGAYERLDILADGTVLAMVQDGAGVKQYAINPQGLMTEFNSSSGSKEHNLHFLDTLSGACRYNATITGSYIHFQNLSTPDVAFQRSYNGPETEEIFRTTTSFTTQGDELRNINFEFRTENNPYNELDVRNGYIKSVTYTHDS